MPEEARNTKTLETPIEELTRGALFADRYEIIEELGQGGMGKVYRVEDKKVREEVALKLIKPDISIDKNTIDRFRNELKLARKIRHKNVSGMYDLGEDKGTYFITMEYVSGQDLKGLIKQSGQLAVGTTLRITKQICEGLAEAHKLGIVHRDLKPSNIMIDEDGNARIMDFGIARSMKERGITGAGVMIGTPEYMSPEQVEGKETDQRSDIYSLGVILYEMLTGRLPFEGDTALSIAMKHKSEAPKNPKELNVQIPDDLSHIILRCLEKDRQKRYQSAGEVCSGLARIKKGIPTTEREVSRKECKTVKISEIKWKNLILYGGSAILLILLIVISFSLFKGQQELIDSIAVLPLENLSDDQDQEYFSDGMTDALIAELSKIEALRVISRTSVMQYKKTKKPLPEIARELNVDAVVEGSVLHAEGKVRITVQLIKARIEEHLWTDSYERELSGILALQSEVARDIAKKIKVTMTPGEEARLSTSELIDPEAHDAYLKGVFHSTNKTEQGLQTSLEYFKQAIEKDPTYASAYSMLAFTYNELGNFDILPSKDVYPRAKAAAEKALELDETQGQAHASLAWVKMVYDWDLSAAASEYQAALKLSPNNSMVIEWYAEYLLIQGRHEEAIAAIKRSEDLSPLSLPTLRHLGEAFIMTGQYDEAIKQLRKTLEMNPDYVVAHRDLGRAYALKGMNKEAIVEFQKVIDHSEDDFSKKLFLAIVYALSERIEEAKKILEELEKISMQNPVVSTRLALIYAKIDNSDKAFEFLEKAYEERDHALIYLKVEPGFDSLRSDPRFISLLKKMGLD